MSQNKTVTLKIPLDLLCHIWDNRENLNDDLDTAIEKLVIRGLEYEVFHAYSKPRHMQTAKPKLNPDNQINPANSPEQPL